ncbi:hypothetical protein OOZ63_21610 [Paucibacter sp. PLA-PC-4]|uniref:hypothetical protein n=1 Tax=Paucibacter sp. PLA-PC-4 TaxID=2993655 RepID=UPI00224A77CB|nr:hypothetical protein [Paucibacter sp. PLA-PC-4]MCX2864430.1 hypothetical protein [Paucibacter sp. PLA-PC-4]
MIRLVPAPAPAQTGSQQSDTRPPQALDVSIEDWDVLFRAVQTRLTQLADTPPGGPFEDAILDCIQALDQLRISMVEEFSKARTGSSARTGKAG